MYSLNVLLCVLRLTTVFFFIYMYYSVFTNTYSVREICTSKTILITTKHAEICFEELHQALRLKWCLSGNPDTLKVTDPQGATGTLQVIVVKQTESFFWIPAPLIGFAAKTASHLW